MASHGQYYFYPSNNSITNVSFTVFLVASQGVDEDYHSLFVEINPNHNGWIHKVTSGLEERMRYDATLISRPEDSVGFLYKTRIGRVTAANHCRLAAVCTTVRPPKNDLYEFVRLDEIEQLDENESLRSHESLRRTQNWTAEAIDKLREQGILDD